MKPVWRDKVRKCDLQNGRLPETKRDDTDFCLGCGKRAQVVSQWDLSRRGEGNTKLGSCKNRATLQCFQVCCTVLHSALESIQPNSRKCKRVIYFNAEVKVGCINTPIISRPPFHKAGYTPMTVQRAAKLVLFCASALPMWSRRGGGREAKGAPVPWFVSLSGGWCDKRRVSLYMCTAAYLVVSYRGTLHEVTSQTEAVDLEGVSTSST